MFIHKLNSLYSVCCSCLQNHKSIFFVCYIPTLIKVQRLQKLTHIKAGIYVYVRWRVDSMSLMILDFIFIFYNWIFKGGRFEPWMYLLETLGCASWATKLFSPNDYEFETMKSGLVKLN